MKKLLLTDTAGDKLILEGPDAQFYSADDDMMAEPCAEISLDELRIEDPEPCGRIRVWVDAFVLYMTGDQVAQIREHVAAFEAEPPAPAAPFRITDETGDWIEIRSGGRIFVGGPGFGSVCTRVFSVRLGDAEDLLHTNGQSAVMCEPEQGRAFMALVAADPAEPEPAEPEPEDYHAAKHDQGKARPSEDLILLMEPGFFTKIQKAARVLDPNWEPGVSAFGRWTELLASIPSPHSTVGIGEAMHYGFQKYGAWGGWRHVPDALARYQEAAFRHFLFEKYYPEDEETGVDSESGIPHLSLAACNIAFVLELLAESK